MTDAWADVGVSGVPIPMREMTPSEVRTFVKGNHTAILGLADAGRAYCIPLYYAFDGKNVYFHTRPGLKDEFAEGTTEACIVIVRATHPDTWASVQLFGAIERVDASLAAMDALLSVPLPPDWGETERGEPARHAQGVNLYRFTPTRASGRYSDAAPESPEEREIAFGGM